MIGAWHFSWVRAVGTDMFILSYVFVHVQMVRLYDMHRSWQPFYWQRLRRTTVIASGFVPFFERTLSPGSTVCSALGRISGDGVPLLCHRKSNGILLAAVASTKTNQPTIEWLAVQNMRKKKKIPISDVSKTFQKNVHHLSEILKAVSNAYLWLRNTKNTKKNEKQ